MLDNRREALYRQLESEIGNTPLYRIQHLDVRGGNTVFVKEENRNPGGSHYDRVFINLFRHYEEQGKIVPGITPVVETTSGSAGASFARLARLLGYRALVICPENLPEGRLRAIREEGAEIDPTPAELYIDGSARRLAEIFTEENRRRKERGEAPYFGLNHTQGKSAELSAKFVEAVVNEAVKQADNEYGSKLNLVVAAGGNGTTALGFGRAAKRHRIPFVVWEHIGSGVYYDKFHGKGRFKEDLGMEPGSIRHELFGAVYGPTPYLLPNIDTAFEEGLIGDVHLVSDKPSIRKWLNILGELPKDSDLLVKRTAQMLYMLLVPTWESSMDQLHREGKAVGRTSAGNIAVAKSIIHDSTQKRDREQSELNILTFFYDDLSRYDI